MPKRCRDDTDGAGGDGAGDGAGGDDAGGACGGCRTAAPAARIRPGRARRMFFAHRFAGKDATVRIHSAYLGELSVPCYDYGNGSVGLQTLVPGLAGQPPLLVKCVDATLNRLDVENKEYPLSYLTRLQPTRVNVAQCRANAALVAQLNAKKTLTAAEKRQRRAALAYNNAVDIHALTCWYTTFLHEKVGINNVANATSLVSCHNVPDMANAFFTGEFMVYGNGADDPDPRFSLDPMGAVDICGHELGHGIVQVLAGLIYQGHAGALNESFADVFGVSFEFWLYKRQGGLKGIADWLMGEDVGTPLRNMLDPTAAAFPQPGVYRGPYWANPNSTADYGGVHTNSGVGNRCFSHRALAGGLDATLAIFVAALRGLKPKASYLDYRDALKRAAAAARADLSQSLGAVGLTDSAVSDWRPPA